MRMKGCGYEKSEKQSGEEDSIEEKGDEEKGDEKDGKEKGREKNNKDSNRTRSLQTNRCPHQRTRRLARQDTRPRPRPHQASRSGSCRGMEVAGSACLVARRHYLHRRDLQECRQNDFRQRRFVKGSCGTFQF